MNTREAYQYMKRMHNHDADRSSFSYALRCEYIGRRTNNKGKSKYEITEDECDEYVRCFKHLLDTKEVCKLLSICFNSLKELETYHNLPYEYHFGRHWYSKKEIKLWYDSVGRIDAMYI